MPYLDDDDGTLLESFCLLLSAGAQVRANLSALSPQIVSSPRTAD
jgi:hypothetical protein